MILCLFVICLCISEQHDNEAGSLGCLIHSYSGSSRDADKGKDKKGKKKDIKKDKKSKSSKKKKHKKESLLASNSSFVNLSLLTHFPTKSHKNNPQA